jgi:cell division protein ZapA (FtsZ GTPase activity inhibitor)
MTTPPTARAPIVLEVAGQRLRLNATSDTDPDHLTRLSSLVNERYERIVQNTRGAPAHTLLVLLALDLADEVLSTRRRADETDAQAKTQIAEAETRAREVEQMARRAIAEAIAEIDRTLMLDEEVGRKPGDESEESETG